jgi:hypothetical protein
LATGDPAIVANRYAKNAILLPTVSGKLDERNQSDDNTQHNLTSFAFCVCVAFAFLDEPRTTKEGITEYFVKFLQNKPQGVITDGITLSGPVSLHNDWMLW